MTQRRDTRPNSRSMRRRVSRIDVEQEADAHEAVRRLGARTAAPRRRRARSRAMFACCTDGSFAACCIISIEMSLPTTW